MSLLVFEHVSKSYKSGSYERRPLWDVSFALERGEMVAIWGRRRSGRSTLLRIAAGLEPPDSGVVRFDGDDLAQMHGAGLGSGIAYCRKTFGPIEGSTVLEHVTLGMLARGMSRTTAQSRSRAALERVGAAPCADFRPSELDNAELARVGIARAIAGEPRLIVIDEPTIGVDLLDRDAILVLLRSLADEGIAVLASAGETTGLLGADRALSLGDGKLRGALNPEQLAAVVPLGRSLSR